MIDGIIPTKNNEATLDEALTLLENSDNVILNKHCKEKPATKRILIDKVKEDFKKAIIKSGAYSLSCYQNKKTGGFVSWELSEWDTDHFGFDVYKIIYMMFNNETSILKRQLLIKEVFNYNETNTKKVFFIRPSSMDNKTIKALEREGALFNGLLVNFQQYIQNHNEKNQVNKEILIYEAKKDDATDIANISRKAFKNTHFHRDFRIPLDKSNELYEKWGYNSCHGLADKIFVAKQNGLTLGFITCKINHIGGLYKNGVIELIAVDRRYRNKRLGFTLVDRALKWFQLNDIFSVYVSTQISNVPAVRLYEGTNFKMVSSELTFHYHDKKE